MTGVIGRVRMAGSFANSGDVDLGYFVRQTSAKASGGRPVFGRPRVGQLDDVRIVADARIDDRETLVAALVARTGASAVDLCSASDDALILHAYQCWGDACVEHLIGDFMFALWDSRRQQLFCARDQMGVKPFYYTVAGNTLVVSNVLDTVRSHHTVSDDLNDLAVADCLLFGMNQDGETTLYRDIRRVPAGHTLTWSVADGVQVQRYWSLPIEEPLSYRKRQEYVEHFNELLDAAIGDRLRGQPVSVFMSGGLDSTLLAARSVPLLNGRRDAVRAQTFVYSQLFADPERAATAAAASHIGISVSFTELDLQPAWLSQTANPTPEPLSLPSDRGPQLQAYAAMARHSPVALYGEGPDNALIYEWAPYLRFMHRNRSYGRLIGTPAITSSPIVGYHYSGPCPG